MQKVIFVGLLALSMCLCGPVEQKSAAQVPQPQTATNDVPKTTELKPAPHVDATAAEKATNQTATETAKQENATAAPPASNKTNEKKEESPKTEPKEEKSKETTTGSPSTQKVTDKPTEAAPTQKADVTTEKAASTVKPDVSSTYKPTTMKPGKADDSDIPVQTRKFDGPSFIGGIVMTLGLLAISFMGYKYYKNQTERNYHTL